MKKDSFSVKSNRLEGMAAIIVGLMFVLFSMYLFMIDASLTPTVYIAIFIVGALSIYIGYSFTGKEEWFITENGIVYERKNKVIFSCKWNEIRKVEIKKMIPVLASYGYIYHIIIKLKDNDSHEIVNDFGWSKRSMKRIFRELIKYQKRYEFQISDELHWSR